MANFRDNSKASWAGSGCVEHINAGSLQRIADACELMATDYRRLQQNVTYYEGRCKELTQQIEKMRRTELGLRGQIGKLMKRIKEGK